MHIRTAPRFCLGGCGRFEKLLYGCRDPSRLHVSGPRPVSGTHKQCDVETGQVSSAETGQMFAFETGLISAAETGQMSAVETRQMYSIKTCLLYTSPSPRDVEESRMPSSA